MGKLTRREAMKRAALIATALVMLGVAIFLVCLTYAGSEPVRSSCPLCDGYGVVRQYRCPMCGGAGRF